MDPVSILAITNASLGIARSMVHTIQELYELAEAYETAALGIRTVATQCNSFRIAVQRVSKWLTTQTENTKHDLDDDFWSALQENLQTATMVMDDLDKRIAGFKKTPAKFWTRTKYLWNAGIISELQTQIGSLMTAMSILIQVIDIPTTGGKRSYSLAQRSRLNHITKSVRHNEEERARIRQRQEQNLLDNPIPDGDLLVQPALPESSVQQPMRTNSNDLLHSNGSAMQQQQQQQPSTGVNTNTQPSFSDIAIPDTAPPSYDTLEGVDASSTDYTDKKNRKKSSGDDKSKRGFWKNVRMSKPASTTSFSSLFSGAKSPPIDEQITPGSPPSATLSRTTSETTNITPQTFMSSPEQSKTQIHQTPAPIDTANDKEYFQLQSAMSGMGMMSSDLSAIEKDPKTSGLSSPPINEPQQSLPTSVQQPDAPQNPYATNNPYAAQRLEAQSDYSSSAAASVTRTKSTYLDQIVPASEKFERLRPSQRVKESQDRSNRGPIPSRESTPGTGTGASGRLNLGSVASFSSSNGGGASANTQKWSTCPMPSRSVNFTVQFEDESFTNRMSAAAARVLGVDEQVVEFAGIPITRLTMLHTVEDEYVAGDEVEFVVMDEHEQRTPLLVLGAGMAHLKRLMQEGEYVYWDSQNVPEKLRTKERLRLYRRFELVRW